ncbi:MAG: hypothetical protein B7Y12_08270 [Rhizobiales bacterium 24-66-13]|nr:MAG: hypothetical protein B7Z41_08570 [Rhizobiales bacterium 12-66-7]OYY87757.1 MAG: hypothetical protein B7Y61_04605 [Rhizobiales bacterium 35-66-30]OYZ79861.1 MAG: hypothetical protein B7Y12_08270 [Rhizobiales bacterium 24-66-13]OZB07919.1 MAG: hypothetical protein B7X67_08335 [Rhizobiales bacterium 39-66-18]
MTRVMTLAAPRPGGHYEQAIVAGNTVFVSGQLGVLRGEDPTRPLRAQTLFALANMEAVLIASGCDRSRVVKTTVYVSDIADWDEVNAAYADFFGHHRPARSVVPAGLLHFGAKLEIEAIAVI